MPHQVMAGKAARGGVMKGKAARRSMSSRDLLHASEREQEMLPGLKSRE